MGGADRRNPGSVGVHRTRWIHRLVPLAALIRLAHLVPLTALAGPAACLPGGAGDPAAVNGDVTTATLRPVFRGDRQVLHPRCRELRMPRVPATQAWFEAEILAWLSSCVKSRTHGVHREHLLARGNPSLAALWRTLTPGQAVWIRPRYVWSESGDRVVRIDFTADPDPGAARGAAPRGPDGIEAPGREPTSSSDPGLRPDGLEIRIPNEAGGGSRRILDPPILDDFLDDARELLAWLYRRGERDEAEKLARMIDRAARVTTTMALLVGGYYIAVKFRAGRLLFQWGWTATGPRFQRALARLGQILPEAESAFGDIVDLAKRHPRFAGSGIDWKVLDQIVAPSIPAQLDDQACGPACLQMVLHDRGIHISQAELIQQARSVMPGEVKMGRVSRNTVIRMLQKLDPGGGWGDLAELLKETTDSRRVLPRASRQGSWIAQVGPHFVVVDELDPTDHVVIRDPWPEPGVDRGIQAGSRYRIPRTQFLQYWFGSGVYRK